MQFDKCKEEKTLNENFKAITEVLDRVESIQSIRKIHKIEKNNSDPPLNPSYYIKQNSEGLTEFIITKIHCNKDFFRQITSAIAHLYGCVMAEL